MQVTLSDAYYSKSKTELIEEIARLNKELRAKSEEIGLLRKRILLYKSIK
jgi:hypothetical protein